MIDPIYSRSVPSTGYLKENGASTEAMQGTTGAAGAVFVDAMMTHAKPVWHFQDREFHMVVGILNRNGVV